MTKVSDALEDWRRARRELETATPWTAEWTRARMVEQDRHAAYEALIDEDDEETTQAAPDTDRVVAPGQMRRPT